MIEPDVLEKFPDLKIGVALIKGVTVSRKHSELKELTAKITGQIRADLAGVTLGGLPKIQAYRKIYRAFGVDPGSRRPSAEALMRRLVKGQDLYNVNTVVDTYNLTSAETQIPMGVYDFDQVAFPIALRFAEGGEAYFSIGASEPDYLDAGELIYADQSDVLCRDFNYRDADKTKVTKTTQNLILFVDGSGATEMDEVKAALALTCERIMAFNGGQLLSQAVVAGKA